MFSAAGLKLRLMTNLHRSHPELGQAESIKRSIQSRLLCPLLPSNSGQANRFDNEAIQRISADAYVPAYMAVRALIVTMASSMASDATA
jgi:hypothetical protein